MKLNSQIEDKLNLQMHNEFETAYAYLSLSMDLCAGAFNGFAHWMRKQYEEELGHAMKFYYYINQCGNRLCLYPLDKANFSIKTPLQAFEKAYEMEINTTKDIHALYALAVECKDYPSREFLHYFIKEQVSEEDEMRTMVDRLKLAGDNSASILNLDQLAGQR